MKKLQRFFWICSGADLGILQKAPTEHNKYAGIGATIFFTGVFAALSGSYALFTVFDSVWISVFFGLLWGLMIFNLDRYIVSGMRKEGNAWKELGLATPRILLALLISIVIAKPLELKIFEKEIAPELVMMEQESYANQEQQLKQRFLPTQDSLKREMNVLKAEIAQQIQKRDQLDIAAQQEADGTGGSKKRNLGPIYKVKKIDADKAAAELKSIEERNGIRIAALQQKSNYYDSLMGLELIALEKSKRNGLAARMEALDRLTDKSEAIAWAHVFIMLLFIAVETAPVLVKLISNKGPYDHLLKIAEHGFSVQQIEELAKINKETKDRTHNYPEVESSFIHERLDAELGRS